ncbi:hypothetical protein [Tessaracoccus sp. G1721]
MLAGILIAIVVVVGLALGLPWVMNAQAAEAELEGDPTERFSDSVRILHREAIDTQSETGVEVSTPLTRRADLLELRLISRQAARRRLAVVAVLVAALAVAGVLAAVGAAPWWTMLVPAGLIVAFFGVARISVVAMHRSLDARSAAVKAGFSEDEDTVTIDLSDREATENIEISIDLSMPTTLGALWDPIPVAPPTYVQQPLLPRTVRTIDLSAPLSPSSPVIPTADNPSAPALAEAEEAPFRPRAIGE